ncbi:hypothetical protein KAR91_07145 [Candidatus Pacearchaeota archaeon]|nr:hypothetical protein [Candidatus Pacearchaeota archaeon]
MPNFTSIDRVKDAIRAPRIGKIHLGVMAKIVKDNKDVYYPKEVEYFVLPDELKPILGEKPTSIQIALHSNDIEEIIPYAYKQYRNGKLYCKGNGKEACRATGEPGIFEDIVCLGDDCPDYKVKDKKKKCSIRALFFVIIPKKSMTGVYQIDTGSWNSIVDIISFLGPLKEQFGRLTNLYKPGYVPLLTLSRHEIQTQGSGRKEKHFTMKIDCDLSSDEFSKMQDALSDPYLIAQRKKKAQDEINDLYNPGTPSSIKVDPDEIDDEFMGEEPYEGPQGEKSLASKIFLMVGEIVSINKTFGMGWLVSVIKETNENFSGDLEELHGMSEEVLKSIHEVVLDKKNELLKKSVPF